MTVISSDLQNLSTLDLENKTYKKITLRILPLLIICYVVGYLDRVNIGVAKLQMSSDLVFSDTVYGLGAGIFFIGFFFFQIPSNLVLHKFGARHILSIILISWAIIAPCTALVRTPGQFYTVRFLLGMAESGFYPGLILYMSSWYPTYRRGRIFALFAVSVPLAGVIGNPLSGWIIEYFHNMHGLAGWQWLFLIEGLPSSLLGIIIFFWLPNRIAQAPWLTQQEKDTLTLQLELEERNRPIKENISIWSVFRNPRVWLLAFIYFCLIAGFYTVSFWMPTLIHNAGVKNIYSVGLWSALPYAAAIVTMLTFSANADRTRERRWHLAILAIMCGIGMIISCLMQHNLTVAMIGLTIGAAGGLSTLPLFWSLPTAFLGGATAAVAIALINSIGNLAGFFAPYFMGILNDFTHSTTAGLLMVSATIFLGAAAIFLIPGKIVNK